MEALKKLFVPLRLVVFCALATFGACAPLGHAPAVDTNRTLSFKPPVPEQWTLPNGLTVLYLKDPELPTVSGTLFLKGGEWNALDLKPGAVGAMGSQMRRGGTKRMSPDRLDLELELLSASVSSSYDDEYGSVSFFALKDDFDKVFSIFSDVVQYPRFDPAQFKIWKGQVLDGIKRRSDSPSSLVSISFKQLIFGKSPYGSVLSSSEVGQLEKLDLLKAHRRLVRPNDAILTISGDIERKAIEQALHKYFKHWELRQSALAKAPDINHEPKPGIYFLNYPFNQSTLAVGQLGIPRLTEDFASISVFNEIFGAGGFTSKLTQEIRVKSGLAYSAYGAIEPALVKGRNYFFVQTKAESTAAAIEKGLGVLDAMKKEPVDDQSLTSTQSSVLNSFIFRFDSVGKLINRRAYIKLLDYPQDYDQRYMNGVRATSATDVLTVAQSRWNVEKFIYVVVGNDTALQSIRDAVADPNSRLFQLPIQELKFHEKAVL